MSVVYDAKDQDMHPEHDCERGHSSVGWILLNLSKGETCSTLIPIVTHLHNQDNSIARTRHFWFSLLLFFPLQTANMDMADVFATMATRPRTFPLRQLTDVEVRRPCNLGGGKWGVRSVSIALCTVKLTQTSLQEKLVDVPRLASEYHLIVITLKSTRCPVCPQLLKILNVYGLDAMTNTYVDPFTQKVWQIDKNRKRVRDAVFYIIDIYW